ncbi:MAG TPA: metal-sulfur cluster assembly factor [Rhodocyclaceae bacterium]
MTEPAASRLPDEGQLREALRNVIDPELGMNVVALGLIYRIEVTAERAVVELTMTSPACPMGDMILDDVESTLAQLLPAELPFEARLVWEPPWTPAMMDERAKAHFGWTPD